MCSFATNVKLLFENKKMVKYLKIGLLLATVWFSNIAFALNECNEDQSLMAGDDLVFKCTSPSYITSAEIKNNQRKCSFTNNNYVMTADTKNCHIDLLKRVSLQQQCPNNSDCPKNNYTFIVENIQSKGKNLLRFVVFCEINQTDCF